MHKLAPIDTPPTQNPIESVYLTPLGEWKVAGDMRLGLPLSESIENYFTASAIEHVQYGQALSNASQAIGQHATPAFKAVTDPKLTVINVVATHQESHNIGHTLAQYAKQVDARNNQIVLFCNSPTDSDETRVARTVDTIEGFARSHPEVPISYFSATFPEMPSIGGLRRIAWDSILYHNRQSQRTDDMAFVTHDADITYMSHRYLATMEAAFTASSILTPTAVLTPRSAHERSGGLLPNMDQVAAWYDFRIRLPRGYYEMGSAISARAYMAVGGIDVARQEGEVIDLIDRVSPVSLGLPGRRFVTGALIKSSARRLYHVMAQGGDVKDFWDGSFSVNNTYRNTEASSYQDISGERRDELIDEIVSGGGYHIDHAYMWRLIREQGIQPDHSLHLARNMRRAATIILSRS